jgi:hypothetical protein
LIRRLIGVLAISLVLYIVGFFVFDEKNGRTIYAFDDEHGIHTGDIPAVAVGGVLCLFLLWWACRRRL